MPLYEYGCEACGHTLEIQQKLADAPLKTCPSCGKDELHKIISATAFVLKGGGWYKDGYSSKKDGEKPRTENQRGDRVERAIKEDKAKTESAAPAAAAPAATPAASVSTSTSDTKSSAS